MFFNRQKKLAHSNTRIYRTGSSRRLARKRNSAETLRRKIDDQHQVKVSLADLNRDRRKNEYSPLSQKNKTRFYRFKRNFF